MKITKRIVVYIVATCHIFCNTTLICPLTIDNLILHFLYKHIIKYLLVFVFAPKIERLLPYEFLIHFRDLSSNSLTGEIPEFLANMKSLSTM